MCGIAGILAFSSEGVKALPKMEDALACLAMRGPDGHGIFRDDTVALGHTRLAIIDTSADANQPMLDESGRYVLIFNGEFFNYLQHKNELIAAGEKFKTESDTEVLLKLFILHGEKCLEKINGFFAFAVWDKQEKKLFLARDRYGIKPLYYFVDEDKLIFASSMNAMVKMGVPKEIDNDSLFIYLQLNYIPSPASIYKNVQKLLPAHYIKADQKEIRETVQYYSIPAPNPESSSVLNYPDACNKLSELMEDAVKLRLISDVPLGTFLSGGLDSSIITALAARHSKGIQSFSIGFKDEPFFDETRFAIALAKKHGTDHHVYSLTTEDLFEQLDATLDTIEEPFADSSALAVSILCRLTRKEVTVALSGDGADELFGGYRKHRAALMAMETGLLGGILASASPILKKIPQSRNGAIADRFRKLSRFAEGLSMPEDERYWRWCSMATEEEAARLGKHRPSQKYTDLKQSFLSLLNDPDSMNGIFRADVGMVLQGDMLVKADTMSMAHSLEVRVPFLDYRIVDLAFNLPSTYKINKNEGKKILRDTFGNLLPQELLDRPKQGFEVPLLKWFRGGLKDRILNEWLNDDFIIEQDIFDIEIVRELKKKLFSANPGDIHARIYGLIVFQHWYIKYHKA